MKVWKQEDWADMGCSVDGHDSVRQTIPGCGVYSGMTSDLAKVQASEESGCQAADPDECRRARDKAIYYLQFSGKTESELRKKLAEQEFSPASVDLAIEFVKKYRYLDDEDYARRFVEKNGLKKSRRQMLYELTQKGITRDILDLVFEDTDVDEEAQICVLLAKRRYPGEDATREEKQKISAFLARKGFSYDAIQSALARYGTDR